MSRSPSPRWCSPFRQGLCPKYFLVKIRLGSVIILRIRERSSRETVTLLTACLNRSCPSKIGPPISSSEESLVPFLRRSPRPLSASSFLTQTQNAIPKIRSGDVPRYTGIVNCFSRIYSEQGGAAFWRVNFTNCIRFIRRKPSICPSRIRSR